MSNNNHRFKVIAISKDEALDIRGTRNIHFPHLRTLPVLISINDSVEATSDPHTLEVFSKYKDVLALSFWDISYRNFLNARSEGGYLNLMSHAMSPSQAEELARFIYQYKDEDIVVHCTAGMSRSYAIALFIARHVYKDKGLYANLSFKEGKIDGGNRYVYDLLSEAWFNLVEGTSNGSSTFRWE